MPTHTIIKTENVKSKVFNADSKVLKLIDKELSYFVEGYFWSPLYRGNMWDGKRHKFSRATNQFPTGLLPRVTNLLKTQKIPHRVIDLRPKAKLDIKAIVDRMDDYGIILRDYQLKGIMSGLDNRNMLFWWPTASGKTILFGGLITAYDLPTLILVNRTDLVGQHKKFLTENTPFEVGTIGGGMWDPKQITIATTQSLWSARSSNKRQLKKLLEGIGYLILDEAHHGEAKTFKKPADDCKNAIIRHGFSGTPYSLSTDDLELESVTGPVLHKISVSDLIGDGYLSIPIVTMNHYKSKEVDDNTWTQVYRHGITMLEERNRLATAIINDRFEDGLSILVTVREKKHGYLIKDELLKTYAVSSRDISYLSGKDEQSVRDKTKKSFMDGHIKILIVTSIWNEGIDVPNANCLVKLDGGGGKDVEDEKGVRTVFQQVGRVLRKTKANGSYDVDTSTPQYCYIDDFWDTSHKWLTKHSQNRLDTYRIEPAFDVRIAN